MQQSNSSDFNSGVRTQANLVSPVLMALFCSVGVPGNVVVVVVIILWFKKDNFTVRLMLNLAASDILCLITLPVWIYNQLHVWTVGRSLCKFFISLLYCSAYSSLLTISMISVQRCLQVCHPQIWTKLGRRGEKVLLCTIWVLGFAFSVPAIFTREIVFNGYKMECGKISFSDKFRLIVAVLETLLAFFLPVSIMITSYYHLHKRVKQGTLFRSRRLTRIVTSIVVTSFVFWSPHHIFNLVEIFAIALKNVYPALLDKLLTFKDSVSNITGSFVFMNSCVNPFLYALASRSLCQRAETKRTKTFRTSNV